jgi:hypothetical protein
MPMAMMGIGEVLVLVCKRLVAMTVRVTGCNG